LLTVTSASPEFVITSNPYDRTPPRGAGAHSPPGEPWSSSGPSVAGPDEQPASKATASRLPATQLPVLGDKAPRSLPREAISSAEPARAGEAVNDLTLGVVSSLGAKRRSMTGIVYPAENVNADEVVLWTFDRRRNWRCPLR
jgi:hypothetical protein